MKWVSICVAPHIDKQLSSQQAALSASSVPQAFGPASPTPSGQEAALPAPSSSSSLKPSGMQAVLPPQSSSSHLAPSGQQVALPASSSGSSLAPSGQPAPEATPGGSHVVPSLAENVKAVSFHICTKDRRTFQTDMQKLHEAVRAKAPGGDQTILCRAHTADYANAAWLADGVYLPWVAVTNRKRVRAWAVHHFPELDPTIVFHEAPWTDLGAASSLNEAERASKSRPRPCPLRGSATLVTPLPEPLRSNQLQERREASRPRPCLALDALAARDIDGQQILRKRASEYTVGEEKLGSGSFGTVFRAKRLKEDFAAKDFAVKRLRSTNRPPPPNPAAIAKSQVGKAIIEAYVLERCAGHPHIISLLDVFLAPSGQFMLVFELFGQDLDALFQQRSGHIYPGITRIVFQHILRALVHLHDAVGIAHTDLKAQNCLILETKPGQVRVKLADFGSAVCADPAQRLPIEEDTVTTSPYRAPELVFGLDNFTASVDVWSLGVLVARLSGDSFSFTKEALSSKIGLQVALKQRLGEPTSEDIENCPRLNSLTGLFGDHVPARSPAPSASQALEPRLLIRKYLEPRSASVADSQVLVPRLVIRSALGHDGAELLSQILCWRHQVRPTASQALLSNYFAPTSFPLVRLDAANGGYADGQTSSFSGVRHLWNCLVCLGTLPLRFSSGFARILLL